jgi:hypothetical protein
VRGAEFCAGHGVEGGAGKIEKAVQGTARWLPSGATRKGVQSRVLAVSSALVRKSVNGTAARQVPRVSA